MLETVQHFFDFVKPYCSIENLMLVAGVLAIAAKALLNSWVNIRESCFRSPNTSRNSTRKKGRAPEKR